MKQEPDQKTKERSMTLFALVAGTVLTVSLAYLGQDPEWFVPLVLLLIGGGLALNHYFDKMASDLRATFVAIAAGGVLGMIYFLLLGIITDSLGYGVSVRSLPLPVGLSLLYLPGWAAGAYLGWWADKKREVRLMNLI